MSGALKAVLRRYRRVVIIGTDAPALGMATIGSAIEQLDHYDAVLVPAEDGGYVLLGASRYHDDLLAGIPWGTKTVLADTLRNLDALGFDYALLPECWDVDRPEDLKRYRAMKLDSALG